MHISHLVSLLIGLCGMELFLSMIVNFTYIEFWCCIARIHIAIYFTHIQLTLLCFTQICSKMIVPVPVAAWSKA